MIEIGLFGRAVHVTVRDLEAARVALPVLLGSRGIVVHGLQVVEPSLEDVFVALVHAAGGARTD